MTGKRAVQSTVGSFVGDCFVDPASTLGPLKVILRMRVGRKASINIHPIADIRLLQRITQAEGLAVRRLSACCTRARCTRARCNAADAFSHKELTSSTTNEKRLPSAAPHGGGADKG